MNMNELNDVFISCHWNIKPEVLLLEEKLKEFGFAVLRYDNEWHTTKSYGQIAQAIRRSKLFLCCITKEYCASNDCNLEFDHAYSLNKPMIPVIIDDVEPSSIDEIIIKDRGSPCGIGFIIGLIYIYICINSLNMKIKGTIS